MQYGEILNTYDPFLQNIYDTFVEYFDDPTMSKVKVNGTYSMYMTKVRCLLSSVNRYIVAVVENDTSPLHSNEKLSNLSWKSLQTRSLTEHYNIPPYAYHVKRTAPFSNAIMRVGDVTEKCSNYDCDGLNITITLLNTKRSYFEYQAKGTLLSALETFQTIISLKD